MLKVVKMTKVVHQQHSHFANNPGPARYVFRQVKKFEKEILFGACIDCILYFMDASSPNAIGSKGDNKSGIGKV